MNLIKIVNELEREKRDIEGKSVDQYMGGEVSSNMLKNNANKKPPLPKVGGNNTFENKIRSLKESLLEVEKDIQSLKMIRKKKAQEEANAMKDNKKRAFSMNQTK